MACVADVIWKPLFGDIRGCRPFKGAGIAWFTSSPATKASEILEQKASLWQGKFKWDEWLISTLQGWRTPAKTTAMMGDPEGPEEGVTASCACTLPGTAMENDGGISCKGPGSSLQWCRGGWGMAVPLPQCAVRSLLSHCPLARPQPALGCSQGEQSHLPKISICLFWI